MKTSIILMLFFLIYANVLYSQTYNVEYAYDAAGNRIERTVIYLNSYYNSTIAGNVSDHNDTLQFNINENTSINVYPNPVSTTLYIEIESNNNYNYYASLVSQSGQTIFTTKMNELKENIDMAQYSNGIYILIIKQDKKIIKQFKIVKQ